MGMEMGRVEGIEKGERTGLLEGIAVVLEMKFGDAGSRLFKKARAVRDVEKLRDFVTFLKTAKSTAEVRKYLE
jgi:hypothetical protein